MKNNDLKPKKQWIELKYTELRMIKMFVRFLVWLVKFSFGITIISIWLLVLGLIECIYAIIPAVFTILVTVLGIYLNENVTSVEDYWREQVKKR